jgi:RNA polymerase sigma factor (sigma-70 family)
LRNVHHPTTVARQVRTLLEEGAVGGLSDGELLERFATRSGDAAEVAFAALVERHGPMVLRACRSILRDSHESQDAFQATFLLLARRAGSLWVRDSLAPWLHSVACRISAGSRAAEARRRAMQRRLAGRVARPLDDPPRDDLAQALHEEIERLPDRLRAPLVLCYLEGLTHEQAAHHLGCPVGTVRSRLARGRERLRRALARRGFAPSTSSDEAASNVVPAPLAALAIQAARLASDRASMGPVARWLIFLSEGVLKPMSIHPIKSAAVLLLASGAIAVGLGVTSGQEPKPQEKAATTAEPARDRSADEKRFEAIEQRLRDVELKLAEVTGSRQPPARKFPIDQNTLIRIRPRFDNALVEKVYVTIGETVRKGDPLLIVRSAELAQAKNDCRTRFIQWDHDQKYLKAREPLFKNGQITTIVWSDTVNDEKKSRLDYLVSREKLATYGMTNEQIDKLLEELNDDRNKALGAGHDNEDITRMTVVSPINGVVTSRDVVPGNFYDQTNILLEIAPPKP